jgi:uncharacterized OB-fold protein
MWAGNVTCAPVTDQLTPRIPPPINDVNRAFWTGGAQGELLILRCDACDEWIHPPVASCPNCDGPLRPAPVSGDATVYTFTVARHPFHPDVPVPYVVAIVELVEQAGLKFTTNIVGCDVDDVEIGKPVHVTFEPAGDAWVPVFRPR